MAEPPPTPLDLHSPICIIGTGIAGLITAHVLLRDGFTSVTLISRDTSVGGTWARARVYDGLFTNNVHGEYRYSALPMPTPPLAAQTGGLLSGHALTDYFEAFSAQFLGGPQSDSSPSSASSSLPLPSSSQSHHPPSSGGLDPPHTHPTDPDPDATNTKDGTEPPKPKPKAHFLMRTEVLDVRRVAVGDWRVTVRSVPPTNSNDCSDSNNAASNNHDDDNDHYYDGDNEEPDPNNEDPDHQTGTTTTTKTKHETKTKTEHATANEARVLSFARIVLASGGNSTPHTPAALAPRAARAAGFLSPFSPSSPSFTSSPLSGPSASASTSTTATRTNAHPTDTGTSPSTPKIQPKTLEKTLICHSSTIASHLPAILSLVPPDAESEIVVVGGGKSAQDICTRLAHAGRAVTMVYAATDAFLASPKPLPDFIRKSRLLSVLTPYPHADTSTRLERFLHTTTLGSALVHRSWRWLQDTAHTALHIPPSSPLRASHALFWSIRVTDSGAARPGSFASVVLGLDPPSLLSSSASLEGGGGEEETREGGRGKIRIMFPRRVVGYYSERNNDSDPVKYNGGGGGGGVVLDDGTRLRATVVVLATGYKSSWAPILSSSTQSHLGLAAYPLSPATAARLKAPWEDLAVLKAGRAYRPAVASYTDSDSSTDGPTDSPNGSTNEPTDSTDPANGNTSDSANPNPTSNSRDSGKGNGEDEQQPAMWVKAIYRGLVPAKNILHRDFAIAGTLFSGNMTYSNEVAAHWTSAYFRGDRMRLPVTVAAATAHAEARAVWMQTRFPEALRWANESACTSADLFTWPQLADEMLADMHLPGMRSGGSWYNWIFKTVDLKEIEHLTEERRGNIVRP